MTRFCLRILLVQQVRPLPLDIRPNQGCHLLRPCPRPPWRRTGSTPLTATESWPASSAHLVRWRTPEHTPLLIGDLSPPAPSLLCRPSLLLRPAHHPRDGACRLQAKKRSMFTVPLREILPLTLRLCPPQSRPHPETVSLSAPR